jgi:hypothetical protein
VPNHTGYRTWQVLRRLRGSWGTPYHTLRTWQIKDSIASVQRHPRGVGTSVVRRPLSRLNLKALSSSWKNMSLDEFSSADVGFMHANFDSATGSNLPLWRGEV